MNKLANSTIFLYSFRKFRQRSNRFKWLIFTLWFHFLISMQTYWLRLTFFQGEDFGGVKSVRSCNRMSLWDSAKTRETHLILPLWHLIAALQNQCWQLKYCVSIFAQSAKEVMHHPSAFMAGTWQILRLYVLYGTVSTFYRRQLLLFTRGTFTSVERLQFEFNANRFSLIYSNLHASPIWWWYWTVFELRSALNICTIKYRLLSLVTVLKMWSVRLEHSGHNLGFNASPEGPRVGELPGTQALSPLSVYSSVI